MTARYGPGGTRQPAARLALLGVFAVNGAVLAAWATRIPVVKQTAGLSTGQLGLVLLAPAVGALVAFELSGRAAARFGSSRTTGACAVLFCLLLPLIALADADPRALFAVLLLFGAGNGALDVAMNTHGVAVEQQLGRPVLSGMHAAFSAGGLAGAATGGAAAAAGWGVGPHFTLAAGVALACAVLATTWLALPPPRSPVAAAAPSGTAAGPDRSPSRPGRGRLGRVLPPGPVLLLGAVGFACLLGEGAAADWSATYLREDTGSTAGQAAVGYAGFSAAMLVGRLAGDALRARLPAGQLLTGSAVLAAAGLLGGLAVGGTAAGIVGFTLLGAGLAVVIPIVFAAAGQLHPDRTGLSAATALARVNTLSYLGFLAGPPLVGLLAHTTGLRAAPADTRPARSRRRTPNPARPPPDPLRRRPVAGWGR